MLKSELHIEAWNQRNEEGLGLIQLAVKPTIWKSIKEDETLNKTGND
jgi:hypothetical protein